MTYPHMRKPTVLFSTSTETSSLKLYTCKTTTCYKLGMHADVVLEIEVWKGENQFGQPSFCTTDLMHCVQHVYELPCSLLLYSCTIEQSNVFLNGISSSCLNFSYSGSMLQGWLVLEKSSRVMTVHTFFRVNAIPELWTAYLQQQIP